MQGMSKDILQPYTATYLNKMWNFVLPEFVAHPSLPGLAPALTNSIYDDSNLSVTPCNGPHTLTFSFSVPHYLAENKCH